jgi:hypothetical protein
VGDLQEFLGWETLPSKVKPPGIPLQNNILLDSATPELLLSFHLRSPANVLQRSRWKKTQGKGRTIGQGMCRFRMLYNRVSLEMHRGQASRTGRSEHSSIETGALASIAQRSPWVWSLDTFRKARTTGRPRELSLLPRAVTRTPLGHQPFKKSI